MKRLLLILILTFSFQVLSKADDVSDLQIEGMALGESLLDYYSENEIKKGIKNYAYEDDSFYEVEFYNNKSFENYENIQFAFKKNDTQYIIMKLVGFNFISNNKKCFKQVDIVLEEIKNILSNTTITHDEKNHPADPSGQSKSKTSFIEHDTGEIWIECYDWSEKITKEKKWIDNFGVNLMSNEYLFWLENKAYK
jgi:hypothetical protein